ncbi:tRNA uridine-5-carboxymethylaminomethyl(34) synthesis GTPase MnmE [Borrelia miyamotoi]|uniref:tRNA modification GTPase MnmE n=1 Tax=Borrelia miyamotoi TaxID=47466 RepID=A0AAX3JMS6_9SPIR|nr:tRNA uridine-5-carboxymethylaminomethyl(34) synthesis GTPase MnmE [Borrelia miyamotoi]QFP42131.1 tRNA uridine-5-carboxymethylaminomethyl(34) synthesis GTPase MnmE [Borrelia miyamotoi]QFP48246.1 tRNA uridine-5-carboxymethylaminomethyl(34) synthesis GTPase MnmE [Borrelia miyamotoi]QGT56005.1 tRNA uridine-5-carboxymethylaminomethyl(34) synthesis GTPase MnmE [Borrelia miyamotoi]QGT56786.1 tRNA uridine-5-carboxymethylaminomethyl(34) synthesis GTPase MnmE [Borrelia miyamotoi]WAZ72048.1 tRNA uridi
MSNLFQKEDDIVALATPFLSSALCVIRSSGVSSIKKFSKMFSEPKRLIEASGHTIHYGFIVDRETGDKLDEVVVCLYRAPKSFTGQDSIEIMAHGSLIGIRRIIDCFLKVGFRMAEPGEFMLRSFLAGKVDLTKAEAVNELISAKTNKTHALAINKLSGSLFSKINLIKKDMLNFLSALSVHLDYETDEYEIDIPFETISKNRDELKMLINSYEIAKKMNHGITLVLAGSVNVGKSSLFNLMLKEDRAIVSSYAGTTRDYIQASFELNGILFNVFDTAGFRETNDFVEQLGIVRSNSLIKEASLVLYMIDLSSKLTSDDLKFIDSYRGHSKVLFVLNKIDLEHDDRTVEFFNSGNIHSSNLVKISTKTLFGIDSLYDKMKSLACFDYVDINAYDVIVSSSRQVELLKKTYNLIIELSNKIEQHISYDMLAFDVYEILDLLGEITGEVTNEDVLNNMFKNFCLGK